MAMTFNVRTKMLLAVMIPIAGMVAFALVGAFNHRDGLLEGRKDHVRQMVESATSILDRYRQLAESGKITADEARERAKADIRDIRFGKGDYVFVYDSKGVLLVLGPKPALEGNDRTQEKDTDGKFYVQEFLTAAKAGGGFVSYDYPRPGESQAVPKVAYVGRFAPWDMVLGCGVYLDDIDESFHRQVARYAFILGLVTLAILGVSMQMVRTITGPLGGLTRLMVRLSQGDHDITVEHARRTDEIGKLAQALEIFRTNAIQLAGQEQEQRLAQERSREAVIAERGAIARQFEERVMTLIRHSVGASGDLHATARDMASLAGQSMTQANLAATAAHEATANVQTVSAASEQLYASISEISRQVADAARISTEASQETSR
ncbi:MAG TPA: cache domain-containing protein, partial [Magnetospirillaceae bacterium]|nr:cache domain-containing protein [Magnetospirillaceae bacterium]